MSDALTPTLTAWDERVLAALPEFPPPGTGTHGTHEWQGLTVWQIAEALDTYDVAAVRGALRGAEHLFMVYHGESKSRKREVWARRVDGARAHRVATDETAP